QGERPWRAAGGQYGRSRDRQNPEMATGREVAATRPQWGRNLRRNRARSWVPHVKAYGFGTGEVSAIFALILPAKPCVKPLGLQRRDTAFRARDPVRVQGRQPKRRSFIGDPPDIASIPVWPGGCRSSPCRAAASQSRRSRRTNNPRRGVE